MREADGRYGRVPECSENGVSLSVSPGRLSRGGLSEWSLGLWGSWCRVIGCDWMECWS